jgi:hypothetical protein
MDHSSARLFTRIYSGSVRQGHVSKSQPVALHSHDEGAATSCEYCGFYLDFTATRRNRFCSDVCRVRAWGLRQRLAAG